MAGPFRFELALIIYPLAVRQDTDVSPRVKMPPRLLEYVVLETRGYFVVVASEFGRIKRGWVSIQVSSEIEEIAGVWKDQDRFNIKIKLKDGTAYVKS